MPRPEQKYIYDMPIYDENIETVKFREESLIPYNKELKKRIEKVVFELNKKENKGKSLDQYKNIINQ